MNAHKIIRKIEEKMTRELLLTANNAGWPCIGYDYGDGFEHCTDYEDAVSTCLNVDDIYLIFSNGQRRAWVRLVYGNDGWDLICDYSITDGFEPVMQKMDAFAESLPERMFA